MLKKKTRNGMNYVGSINRRLSFEGADVECPVDVEDAVETFIKVVSMYLTNRDNATLKVDDWTMVVQYDTTDGRQEQELQIENVSVLELMRSSYALLFAICGPLAANLLSLRCACGVMVKSNNVEVMLESAVVGAPPVPVTVPNTSEFRGTQLDRVIDTSCSYIKNVLIGDYYEQNV